MFNSDCKWTNGPKQTSKKVKLIELNKFKRYIYANVILLQLKQEVMSFKPVEKC